MKQLADYSKKSILLKITLRCRLTNFSLHVGTDIKMKRSSIICTLSCTSFWAMLRCSVSWVSSIKKGKASVQEVPVLAHSPFSLLHPNLSPPPPPPRLVLYPHRVKPPGRPDHSSRLRGIDVRVRGGSRLILHTQAGAEPNPGEGKPGSTGRQKLPGKNLTGRRFIHDVWRWHK